MTTMAVSQRSKNSHLGVRYTRVNTHVKKTDDVWKEEVEALKNIKSGKTKMEKQSADRFLKELKELENA